MVAALVALLVLALLYAQDDGPEGPAGLPPCAGP